MPSLFPRDVFDEACDLIESVSEGFLTYFCLQQAGTRTIMKSYALFIVFFFFFFFFVL